MGKGKESQVVFSWHNYERPFQTPARSQGDTHQQLAIAYWEGRGGGRDRKSMSSSLFGIHHQGLGQ